MAGGGGQGAEFARRVLLGHPLLPVSVPSSFLIPCAAYLPLHP